MNVGELKAKLADLPDDMMVVVNGYEGDYTELKPINIRELRLEPKGYESAYFGEWEEVYYGDPVTDNQIRAIALERY